MNGLTSEKSQPIKLHNNVIQWKMCDKNVIVWHPKISVSLTFFKIFICYKLKN